MIAGLLYKTGAAVRSHGMMNNSVSQSVLLYGSESLVVAGEMLKVLEGFHHRAASQITGMTATHGTGGEC